MAGYSVGSMITNPAAQSGRALGTIRFACCATDPRGSRRSSRLSESSAASACILSKTVSPDGASTPPTTTFPTSPPAWQPTTVIARQARMA